MEIQNKLDFIEKYKTASNAATGSQVDANANVTEKNIATLSTELGKSDNINLQRAVMRKYITKLYGKELADQYEADLKHHIIYRHDETTGSGGFPYCCSISLYPFLLNGLKNVGGNSEAPKHMDSFIGGFCNLLFIVAAQFAGAVATGEWLTYCDHFLRIDYGQDYTEHLDDTIEIIGGKPMTLKEKIAKYFAQVVYTINQPAAARGNQSIFWNIAYFDKYYFASIFDDFVFPDGDEPKWETTKVLQKLFMNWFNDERLKAVLTFPVETMNLLVNKENHKYEDEEMAQFASEMWAKGASFFCYQSDSVDSLSSCCFGKDQKVLAKSINHGVTKIYYDTFEHLGETQDGPDRKIFKVFHNGNWCEGKKITLPARPMYKIITANNKEIIVSDNHLNPTLRGDIHTADLTTDDYLMFNTKPLEAIPEQDLHLTYEQGFAVGAFLGDGSFGSTITLASGEQAIYDINYSQNKEKYEKCANIINIANNQLGGESSCKVSITDNLYAIRISSKKLADFIINWTNWHRGITAVDKELNMLCLLQSKEFRQGILDGWYNTDGGNSNRCYTISTKLVDCMETLITSLGKNSIVDKNDRSGEKITIHDKEYKHNYPLYCVRWYDPKIKRQMQNVYKFYNNSIYFKIRSIEPIEYKDDNIYCFEMTNQEEPYFTLPNGLITHNCRLRNEVTDIQPFSYTLGAGAIETGSKAVITMNLNRIVQDWSKEDKERNLAEYITEITDRIHKYLNAFNEKLWDDYNANLLTIYKAGYINLNKQYLTVGVNGFLEAAEFLGIKTKPDSLQYLEFSKDTLGIIEGLNKKHRTDKTMYNLEFVPAENAAVKLYNWDKRDGYVVPKGRNLYNSYFYAVEDETINPVEKFYYQGKGYADICSGGVALHNNLDEHLTAGVYRKLMDVAVKAGCNYWTYNIRNTVCNDCGFISKHTLDTCPKCGGKNLDYLTRVIGLTI